jgi:uracil-DNA glycosylase
LTSNRKAQLEAETPCGDVTVVPLYHPAAAFYNQDLRETMYEDFLVLKRVLASNDGAQKNDR